MCCDDLLDPGCEVGAHTSVTFGFVGNVLSHILQELGPFSDPTFPPIRRWGAEPPEEDHCHNCEDPAVSRVVFVIAKVHAYPR